MKINHYLICYDIKEDDVRTSVSDACKEFGLSRIQYSVFFGTLTLSHLKELQLKHKIIIPNSDANIQYFHICQTCISKHTIQFAINQNSKAEVKEELDEEIEFEYNNGVVFY